MEYIYAAMLLHKSGQKVDEASVKKVLEAAGVKADDARTKALIASLEGVDIDKAIETAAIAAAPAVAKRDLGGGRRGERRRRREQQRRTDHPAGERPAG